MENGKKIPKRSNVWSIKHGHVIGGFSPTYRSWNHMKDRCENQNSDVYAYYGGRGVKLYAPWRDFKNFLADMGERRVGTTLERINNAGDYKPGNCRWATSKDQQNNTRYNVRLELNGVSHTVAEWAAITGLHHGTLRSRIRYGWTVERILSEPKSKCGRACSVTTAA